MSRRLDFFYDILLEFDQPVRGHDFVLRCLPPSFPGQEILDVSLALESYAHFALQRDGFGNLLQLGRIEQPHDHFRYTVRGTAMTAPALRRPEAAHPIFRYPSPYASPAPAMEDFLRALDLPEEPSARAWALVTAVQGRMAYTPGVTGVNTTAAQAFETGMGVCQDFAHVYLALARASGLTARYANGLTQGEGASHAWCEVWLDGLWTGIDPTRGRWTDDSYIRFGVGRDFGDCPIERGVFLGGGGQRQSVYMKVTQQ
ncbi:MAG: transglutaminase family protein [Oscillospiraceae bacterium]|nr:transglutaminase family protein [Oscillospiraceae bacterium]